jgi:AAA domain-containing protein
MTSDIEISVPVADGIASWRRVFASRKNGVDARDLLRRAAAKLRQTLEIDKTVHPKSHGVAWQDTVDALHEMAESSGIGPDDAQQIFAEAFKAPASNGNTREHSAEPERTETSTIRATPFAWIDPASIPPRKFLYGRHLVRQFVSTTISHGGSGKSALEITEALAMTSNLPLLGMQPGGPLRVWYWNGEDPREEIERRVMATALHYRLTPDSIGQLYVDTGREMPIIIAEQTRDGAKILVPIVDAVIKTIQDEHIDAAIIDPFVSSHRVTENDNNAIELVVKKWAHIADVTNSAIELVHHSRKTGADVTVQDSRGAIALLAAARSARVLNVMSDDEANQAGVENRKWYFRADNGKSNLAPPADKAAWFRFVSVELGNGDDVGVPTPWHFPNPFDDITAAHLHDAQKAVAAGGPWRENQQASDWVGKPIAKVLKLNPDKKADKKKISMLIKVWIANGAFARVTGKDPKRRDLRTFIEVGQWAD